MCVCECVHAKGFVGSVTATAPSTTTLLMLRSEPSALDVMSKEILHACGEHRRALCGESIGGKCECVFILNGYLRIMCVCVFVCSET